MVTLTKKEKLLASAQKSLQKGQISKAIKDYQKLVELEPNDLRNRQKLAELYNRSKMPALAIEEFQKVGKHYTDNGFFLKAIAVYKQIQRIDAGRDEVYLKLAELNEKQGLIGNALAEYRSLIAHYEKCGDSEGVVKVLQKMKSLDPENLNIRVKLAETFAKKGRQDEALEDFQDVLKVLQAKKDSVKILKLHEIFVGFFPEEESLMVGLGQALIQKGDVDKGISLLEPLHEADPAHQGILRSLAEGYRKKGEYVKEATLYTRLVASYPGDLDLRELQIQACLDGGALDQALKILEETKAAFFEADRVPRLKEYYEQLRELLPGEERVVATLHSIYEVSGEGGKLFDMLSAGKSDAASAGTAVKPPFEAADEFEELDFGDNSVATADEVPLAEPEPEVEELEEIPLEFLQEVDGEAAVGEVDTSGEEEELSLELEVDDAFGDLQFDSPEEPVDAGPLKGETLELNDEELSFSFDDEETSDAPAEAESLPDFDSTGSAVAGDVTAQIEEAGFYLTQGLFSDAERVCTELLAAQPECREAEELLADIRSRREQGAAGLTSGEDDFFNFSAEVMAEVEDAVEIPAPAAVKKSRYAMEGEFSQFKKGVEEQIGSEDAESHFNLGIAYREMGLIDDAIGEFNHAMKDPARRFDCLTLKGICLLDKKDFEGAETSFKLGLSTSGLAENQRISLFYELGLLYEAWDRPLDALDSFQSAADVDLFFRNVRDKIQGLRNRLGMEDGDDGDSNEGGGGKDRVSYV